MRTLVARTVFVRALCATLGAVLLATAVARAGWDPPGWRSPEAEPAVASTSPVLLPMTWLMQAYRATVSRVDGDRCPSYPSCSHYALEALEEHGSVLGIALTAGRLLAEADEAAFAPRIFVNGKWKVYSPVDDDLAFLRGPLDP